MEDIALFIVSDKNGYIHGVSKERNIAERYIREQKNKYSLAIIKIWSQTKERILIKLLNKPNFQIPKGYLENELKKLILIFGIIKIQDVVFIWSDS